MTNNKQKYPPYSENSTKCHPENDENSIVISNENNVNCPLADVQGTSVSRRCLPIELVKNGGFEQPGVFETFANWDEITSNYTIRSFTRPYEGRVAAEIISEQTANATIKTAILSQQVAVTPGCFLVLSFAENFRRAGDGFDGLNIRASVFYEDVGRVNLINVEIGYDPEADQAGQGFVFHQRVADNPVPLNVSKVTVEFFVQVTDVGNGGNTTQWLLDGVSLRAV